MAAENGAASAYESQQMSALEGRSLDAVVLLKAAGKLQEVLDCWDSIQSTRDLDALTEALRYNQRLWSVFQVDIASPSCQLPIEMRRNLLTLSRYVDRSTFQTLAAPERSRLRALIAINRQLAEGLSAAVRPAPETQPAPAGSGAAPEPEGCFDLCY